MRPTHAKKCAFCNKPVANTHFKYCPRCFKFAFRIMNTRLSPEAIKGIRDYVRQEGFKDYYSKMPLEMEDTHSPFYGACSKNCDICAKFVARLHSKGLPPETIEATLDYIRKNGFKYYYTGMDLELHDTFSPWYCVFDYWIHQSDKIRPDGRGILVLCQTTC